MRPLSLKLKNFGSYKSESLSFEDFDIAVISGESGSGKSTIPDAIIWALYGRSERDSVLSHAADEKKDNVEVDLVFELDGMVYEVNRKRGSKSDLTLWTVDDNGGKENISAKGIKAVDAQIQELLGMDYQTFRLTAFVPQDGVNTFANLGPADRKRFLEQFLDTAVWNKLLEKAKTEEMQIVAEKSGLVSSTGRLEELAANDDISEQLSSAEKSIENINRNYETLNSEKVQKEFEIKTLLESYQKCKISKDAEEIELEKIADEINRIVNNSNEPAKPTRSISEIRSEIDALNEKWRIYNDLKMKHEKSKLDLETLEEKLTLAQKRFEDESLKASQCDTIASGYQKDITACENVLSASVEAETEKNRLNALISENEAKLHILKQELDALTKRENALSESNSQCPVCGCELTEAHKQEMLSEISSEKEENKNETETVLAKQNGLRAQVFYQSKVIDDGVRAQKKLVDLTGKLSAVQNESKMHRANSNSAKVEIEKERYADRISDEKNIQNNLLTEMNNCGFSLELLRDLQLEQKIASEYENFLKAQQERKDKVKQLEAVLYSKNQNLLRIEKLAQETEISIASARKKYDENDYQSRLAALAQQKSEISGKANQLRKELGKLESLSEDIAKAKDDLPKINESISELTQRLEDVRELIVAYGDKGIKALLIDQMLPSITKEANNVLSLLSDGRFTLEMTTLKETKKGDEVETLDILLYKDGIRDRYENLSGGEKFKVNFSLRIGLSKYLSEAADTRLDTLVIDEGFGSQDYTGRLNALRAIQAVSDRFGLILVITHFNDIQKAFDYEIETHKDVAGFSHAEVVYHPAA